MGSLTAKNTYALWPQDELEKNIILASESIAKFNESIDYYIAKKDWQQVKNYMSFMMLAQKFSNALWAEFETRLMEGRYAA